MWFVSLLLVLGSSSELHVSYQQAMQREYTFQVQSKKNHSVSQHLLPQTIAFIEESSDMTLLDAATTRTFCETEIHLELRRKISRDISTYHSQQAMSHTIASSVSAFNDAFINPFTDLLALFIVNPLVEAMRDVLPWYLTGPIQSVLTGMSPKPVVASIDALLGMYMPPLIAIAVTKKLVKGLVLVLTASLISMIERTRTGNGNAISAGDGGGSQIVTAKEISRRVGIDITNHLMETVPRATDRALAHTLSASLSTSVQLFYYCTYCYWFGDYCKLCFYLPDYTWKEGQWWQKQRKEHLADRHYAQSLEKQTNQAIASFDKPISPITATDPTTMYKQKMTNDLALKRRAARLANTSNKLYKDYMHRMDTLNLKNYKQPSSLASLSPIQMGDKNSESTVETSEPEAQDNRTT